MLNAGSEIYTNGTLLTEARLMTLLTLGVDKFIVTRHHGIRNYPFEDLHKTLDPSIQSKIKFQGYKELRLSSRGGLVKVGPAKQKPPLDLHCLIPSSLIVMLYSHGKCVAAPASRITPSRT